jgi:DNA polymerase-4
MDAFYASVEQREHPEYKGKPLAVGYSGSRGVVAAASYEARKYGIHSAMASKMALRKCPHLIFVSPDFTLYKSVSEQVMEIFLEYTDMVEPLSLDEAYLDVTENKKNIPSAIRIAIEIKQKILEKTGLTASAGISYNKFLAKIASDYKKPNGLFYILQKDGESFVRSLEIEKFYGVGKVTARVMHSLGIKTGDDLYQFTELELIRHFGKAGSYFYLAARGLDYRKVENERIHKSVGAETTFEKDIDNISELTLMLRDVAEDLTGRLKDYDFKGRTVTLKIKYADFKNITRSRTYNSPVLDFDSLFEAGKELLNMVDITPKVRLIGLSVKNNNSENFNFPRKGIPIQLEIDFKY